MVEDVPRSLEGALELIAERAREDPELAGALRTVLTGMLARLPEQAAIAEPAPAPVAVAEPVPDAPTYEEPEPVAEPEPQYTEWPDLEGVGDNLRLKARASRWVARHGYTEERDALNERYALLDETRAAECYLWMLDRNRVDPFQSVMLTELADLLENLKDGNRDLQQTIWSVSLNWTPEDHAFVLQEGARLERVHADAVARAQELASTLKVDASSNSSQLAALWNRAQWNNGTVEQ